MKPFFFSFLSYFLICMWFFSYSFIEEKRSSALLKQKKINELRYKKWKINKSQIWPETMQLKSNYVPLNQVKKISIICGSRFLYSYSSNIKMMLKWLFLLLYCMKMTKQRKKNRKESTDKSCILFNSFC